MLELNKIYNMDCLEGMKLIEDNSIDMVITSPPYFNLRDYGNIKEIGDEETPEKYIENLKLIFKEVSRILKPSGSCWINIADVYSNKKNGNIKRKSLLALPDRLKISMIDNGWICRNEIIWHKPNAIPSSVKDRFVTDYEKLFLFTKQEKYYFETQYEDRSTKIKSNNKGDIKNSKYKNIEQESSVRQGMNKERGSKLIEKRNLLPHLEFVEKLRNNFTKKELYEVKDLKPSTIDHWFRKDEGGFSYPKKEDWEKVLDFFGMTEFNQNPFPELLEVYYETDDINKNAHKGRIKRSVWSINTKPFKGGHFAPYPEDLIKTPIKAGCPENGIVLDIFMGSGTTGLAARKLKRNYIGFELNKEYVTIANERIKNHIQQLEFKED